METIQNIKEKEEWFGMVRWNKDDLKNALEVTDHLITENNIDELFCALNKNDDFTECMITAGWDFIYDIINKLEHDGELD